MSENKSVKLKKKKKSGDDTLIPLGTKSREDTITPQGKKAYEVIRAFSNAPESVAKWGAKVLKKGGETLKEVKDSAYKEKTAVDKEGKSTGDKKKVKLRKKK